MRGALLGSLLLLLAACAPPTPPSPPPAPPPPATAQPEPTPPPDPPKPPADPFALPDKLRTEPLAAASSDAAPPALPAARKDTRGPDKKACRAWASRRGAKAPVCKEKPAALDALDAALSEKDADKRDALLVSLETCEGLPPGLVRALRADLAPTTCADVLVEPVLARPPKGTSNAVLQVLTGQALAARLSRLGGDLPPFKPPYDRQHVLEHIKGPIAKWLVAQTSAIEETSQTGVKLGSYARALVAIEAGMADMRLVESARSVPIPTGWDAELKSVYFAALDEALEPRKIRGRDAALVGLGEMAALGVLSDARLDKVRTFLTKLYRGRRVDALDDLMLPAMPAFAPKTTAQKLAGKLPTFYAAQLLDASALQDADGLRALLERGLPVAVRAALQSADLTPEQRRALMQARLELGKRYWRGFDFDEAAALASKWSDKRPDEVNLLYALALALRSGPENVAAMMLKPPSTSLGIGDVSALDQIASSSSSVAALAAYDAALLLAISPPETADAAYWKGVAKRFRDAAAKLSDPRLKTRAEDDARQADEVAGAIGGK